MSSKPQTAMAPSSKPALNLSSPSHAHGELAPLILTHRHLAQLFPSPRLLRQMIKHGWFRVLRQGKQGRETLFDASSVPEAWQRLKNGELPPKADSDTSTT